MTLRFTALLLLATLALTLAENPSQVINDVTTFAMWKTNSERPAVQRVESSAVTLGDVVPQVQRFVRKAEAATTTRTRVVAFVAAEMSSAAFARLTGAYGSSAEAASAPLSSLRQSIAQARQVVAYTAVHKETASPAAIVEARVDRLHRALMQVQGFEAAKAATFESCEAAREALAAAPETSQDELIFVRVPEVDATLNQCMDAVLSGASNAHSVGIFAAETGGQVRMFRKGSAVSPSLLEKSALLEAAALEDSELTGVQYITGTILFGLLVAFMLLCALGCGTSCMMGIQTPLRFPSKKIPLNKLY